MHLLTINTLYTRKLSINKYFFVFWKKFVCLELNCNKAVECCLVCLSDYLFSARDTETSHGSLERVLRQYHTRCKPTQTNTSRVSRGTFLYLWFSLYSRIFVFVRYVIALLWSIPWYASTTNIVGLLLILYLVLSARIRKYPRRLYHYALRTRRLRWCDGCRMSSRIREARTKNAYFKINLN